MLAHKYFSDYLKNKVKKINILYSWLSLNCYWFREHKHQMTNMAVKDFSPCILAKTMFLADCFDQAAILLRNCQNSTCLRDLVQTDIQFPL